MIQPSHLTVYDQNNSKWDPQEMFAQGYSQQHYSEKPIINESSRNVRECIKKM